MSFEGGDTVRIRVKTLQQPDAKELEVKKTTTVFELKRQISESVGAQGKYVRLIASGKMLQPDSALVEQFCPPIVDGGFVHAVVTSAPPNRRLRPGLLASHPHMSGDLPEDDDDDDIESLDPTQLHGFDRLRTSGFGRSEIHALRGYFRAHVREHQERMQREPDESDLDFERRAETEWMALQGRGSEWDFNTRRRAGSSARNALSVGTGDDLFGRATIGEMDAAPPGSMRDFVWGFIMGFFLGVIMLFWLWERSVSQKQKMGIITGVSLQLSLNFVHQKLPSSGARTQ